MPYTLNSTFKNEKNKQSNRPVYLYTVHDYDGLGNNLRFTEYDADVVYPTAGGLTYTRFPIRHDIISENSQGEIDTFRVSISNVSRYIQTYLEAYDFRGKKVTVRLVWANQLADAGAYMDFIYYIDSYTVTQETADFTLTSKFDLLDVTLPLGKFNRNFCRWLAIGGYKGAQCLATSLLPTCDGTKAACKVRLNITRYGAFPSIPSQKLYT